MCPHYPHQSDVTGQYRDQTGLTSPNYQELISQAPWSRSAHAAHNTCVETSIKVHSEFSGNTFVSLTGWPWHSIKTSKYESISHSSLGQMCVSPVCGCGGERGQQDQARFHNNTEQDGVSREKGTAPFSLRGGPIYQGQRGRGSIHHDQTLALCSASRAAKDPNQSADEIRRCSG